MPMPASGTRGPREPDTGYAAVPEVPARRWNQHRSPGYALGRPSCRAPVEILRLDAPPARYLRGHSIATSPLHSCATDTAWRLAEPMECARIACLSVEPQSSLQPGDGPGLCSDGSDVREVSDRGGPLRRGFGRRHTSRGALAAGRASQDIFHRMMSSV